MARVVYEANGTEVWRKAPNSVHLAVVARPIDGDFQGARERAWICAAALNEHQATAEARREELPKAG